MTLKTLAVAFVGPLLLSATVVRGQSTVGAKVPFVTIEAEEAQTNGRVVRMEKPPGRDEASAEIEASGRSYIRLEEQGQYCELTAKKKGNALTIRQSIPDAATGGGATASLSLYINGRMAQKLSLDSRFNWLYGKTTDPSSGQSNDPESGSVRLYWNDTPFLLTEHAWKAGDVIRLQKDADDTAKYYSIDLVDLEWVPPPFKPPSGRQYLSVTDFGATGNDRSDDTKAFSKCVAAAKERGVVVWVPAGTYYQDQTIAVDGVRVAGAGMWHTKLIGTAAQLGFQFSGQGSRVADLSIESVSHQCRKDPGGKAFRSRFTDRWIVENVRIMHMNCGFWLSGATNGVLRGCRVYSTYADAININRSAVGNRIEHNYVRGAGDDGIATLADRKEGVPSADNKIYHNTVIANWWGHNIDIAGGHGHIVENNYLADNSHSACLALNHPSAYPKYALTGAIVRNNTIVRGGGNVGGQRRGAIWTLAGYAAISGVRIENNQILHPIFRALHLHGNARQEITFTNNEIDSPGIDAFRVDPEVNGKLTLRHNKVRNLLPSAKMLDNAAGENFELVE